ncbi:MAG: hypothetical protein QOG33_1824 [Gaiellales bacterium]|nr:hypothetical protein [Gaiellales bacterium]
MLLLHALGLDHTMWQPQTVALHDCLVLAPDLPGFGRSRFEQGGLDADADECAALLRSHTQAAVAAGVSYGGYVAALLAAAHPDLVAGVALSGVRRQVPRAGAMLQAAVFRGARARSLSRGESRACLCAGGREAQPDRCLARPGPHRFAVGAAAHHGTHRDLRPGPRPVRTPRGSPCRRSDPRREGRAAFRGRTPVDAEPTRAARRCHSRATRRTVAGRRLTSPSHRQWLTRSPRQACHPRLP